MYRHHGDGWRVQGGYQHDFTWSLHGPRVRISKAQPPCLLKERTGIPYPSGLSAIRYKGL